MATTSCEEASTKQGEATGQCPKESHGVEFRLRARRIAGYERQVDTKELFARRTSAVRLKKIRSARVL